MLVFVDPRGRDGAARQPDGDAAAGPPDTGEFDKLLKAWGVAFDPKKVAGDITLRAPRAVRRRRARQRHRLRRCGSSLDRNTLDESDVLSGGIERLNLAAAGFLAKAEAPPPRSRRSSRTSAKAMQIGAESVGPMPDAVGLLRNYKPEASCCAGGPRLGQGQQRLPGRRAEAAAEAKKDEPATTRPGVKEVSQGDRPRRGQAKAARRPASRGRPSRASRRATSTSIVIADTDLLNDQFWVEVREFLGQQVAIPNAHNVAFVLAALENLSGSDALISLRGRGISDRPFELVDELRRDCRAALPRQGAGAHRQAEGGAGPARQAREGRARARPWCCPTRIAQAIEKFRGEMLVDAARAARGQARAAQGHRPARRLAQVRQHRRACRC